MVAAWEVEEEGEEEAGREACGDGEGAWQTWGVVAEGACLRGAEGVVWGEVHSSCWEEDPSGDRAASGTRRYTHSQSSQTVKRWEPVVIQTQSIV